MDHADMELVCDGQSFPCHKFVMGARSNVFRAMFSHDMREAQESKVGSKIFSLKAPLDCLTKPCDTYVISDSDQTHGIFVTFENGLGTLKTKGERGFRVKKVTDNIFMRRISHG